MSNDLSNQSPIDRAIDRAVRDMVQSDPRPGFRQRVLARIDAPGTAPWGLVPRLAFAAAFVLLLLAVLVPKRQTPAEAPVSVAHPVAPSPAVVAEVRSAPVATNPAAAPVKSPAAPVTSVRKPPGPVSEPIPMPRITNVFGARDERASAASIAETREGSGAMPAPIPIAISALAMPPLVVEERPAAQEGISPPAMQESAQPSPPGGRANITLELTITDQTGSGEPVKKVVMIIVADRQSGSIRSNGVLTAALEGSQPGPANERRAGVVLNVDASPTIQPDNSVLVSLTLEYVPRPGADDARGRWQLNERMGVMVESGKSLMISQASDAGSNRRITVDLKATISRSRP